MRTVSFDFDDTLLWTVPDFEQGASSGGPSLWGVSKLQAHLKLGDRVLIVTSRRSHSREDLDSFLRAWGWEHLEVFFTEGELKAPTLERLGVQIHHDDDQEELKALPPHIQGVRAPLHPGWEGFSFT